ncbi:MAG: hypothetical protein EBS41_03520 [Actinobacteria bacterium]|nr:hypothetical protein [Actinomycetota bacterium]
MTDRRLPLAGSKLGCKEWCAIRCEDSQGLSIGHGQDCRIEAFTINRHTRGATPRICEVAAHLLHLCGQTQFKPR